MSSKQKYLGICSLGRVYITDLRGARRHLAKFMAMHCISVSSSRYMHSPKYCQYWTLKIFWDTHCTKLFLQINTLNKLRFGFFRSCVRTLIKKVSTTSLFFKNITQILTLHKQHITVLLHDRHYFFFFFFWATRRKVKYVWTLCYCIFIRPFSLLCVLHFLAVLH